MKKTITLLAIASLLVIAGCARHRGGGFEFARLDPLLFDHGGQFRTFYV